MTLKETFESCARHYCEDVTKSDDLGNVLLNFCRFVGQEEVKYAEMMSKKEKERLRNLPKRTQKGKWEVSEGV